MERLIDLDRRPGKVAPGRLAGADRSASEVPARAPRSSQALIGVDGLVVHGKSVPLLSGEIQFFRMHPDGWGPSLDALVEAGLPLVSTYLGWRRFSIGPDRYDLEGRTDPRLDVRAFLAMCSERKLLVILKPGPWMCAEDANGGYPDWLVAQPDLQVLDAGGRVVQGYQHPFQSPIPSYAHPSYLAHARIWLEEVDRIIRDWTYPRGPVVLVQLDNEPCLTFHDRLLESDYNAAVAGRGGEYSRWLQAEYGELASINEAHGAAWRGFEEIEPPRALTIRSWPELRRCTDWAAFKESLFARHIAHLGRIHAENGLDGVAFTVNYNDHPQLAVPNDWALLESAADIGGFDYYPRIPMGRDEVAMVARSVAYSRAVNRIPWSPEIMSGIWSFEGQRHGAGDVDPQELEFLYLLSLAFGLKGMNFYMFADRDNWVGSPLDARGGRGALYPVVQGIVELAVRLRGLGELERRQPAAVLYYRPYAREAFVVQGAAGEGAPDSRSSTGMAIGGYRLGSAYVKFEELFSSLLWSNRDPAIVDPWVNPEPISPSTTLFVANAPYMDRSTQRLLAEHLKAGGRLSCTGALPRMDLDFKPCTILADAVGENDLRTAAPAEPDLRAPLPDGVLAVARYGRSGTVLFVANTNDREVVAQLDLGSGEVAPDLLNRRREGLALSVSREGAVSLRLGARRVGVVLAPRRPLGLRLH